MQKKGLIFPIVIIVAMFVVLSTSMILIQEKKLTGFAIYNTSANACGQTMIGGSTFSANVTCSTDFGLNITCSSCILDCQNYNFTGDNSVGQVGLWITGSSITIQNCSMSNWNICNSSAIINGGGNSGTCFPTSGTDNPPVSTLIFPTNLMKNSTNTQNFNCSATDDYNVTNITIYVYNLTKLYNTSLFTLGIPFGSHAFPMSSLPDGNYTWNCLAYDNSSQSDWDTNRTLTIDTIPPYFTVNSNQTLYNNASLAYQVNATDETAMSGYAVNDTTNFAINSSGYLTNKTALTASIYNLNITINDTANNLNSTILKITVNNFDNTAPYVAWKSPTNTTYNNQTLIINISSDSTNSSIWWYNGTTNISYSSWVLYNFTDGSKNITAYANDSANNVNSTSITFTMDTIPPYFTALANQTINTTQSLGYDINAEDITTAVSGFAVNDTTNFAINSSGYLTNKTTLLVGIYNLNITINDSVNNLNSSLIKINVTAIPDTTSPVLHLTSPSNNLKTNNTAYTFSCNITDNINATNITFYMYNSSSLYNISSSIIGNTSFTSYFNISAITENNYTWNCNGCDNSSNCAWSNEGNRTLDVDRTSPTITFNCTPTSVTVGGTVTCSCSATDISGLSSSVTYTTSPSTSTAGTFTEYCYATDNANNQGNSSATYTVTSAGGGGGGGGGGGSCTPSCTGKTCGSNGCGGSCGTCSSGYECSSSQCVRLTNLTCTDECTSTEYPKCKNSNTAESCLLNSSSGCYYTKEDSCSEKEDCANGTCKIKIIEEVVEEKNPIIRFFGGTTNETKRPSSIIPHGNIPPVIVDTATYTAGTAIIVTGIHFLWIWLISLFLPFFLLRLKHFCLAFIDTKTILPFAKYDYDHKGNIKSTLINKKEIEKFITLLQKQFGEKIMFIEAIADSYRFLFEKSGFIEMQLDSPVIINAHFSSSSRVKHFKLAFLNTIRIMYGNESMNKVNKGLILTKESTTIIAALRNISRARKLRKISRGFAR